MGRLTINPCVLGMISTNCYLVYENQGSERKGNLFLELLLIQQIMGLIF